jgi:hypothetical protein
MPTLIAKNQRQAGNEISRIAMIARATNSAAVPLMGILDRRGSESDGMTNLLPPFCPTDRLKDRSYE